VDKLTNGHVTCIMITKPSRKQYAMRAILNYLCQTHEERSLIVMTWDKAYAEELEAFVDEHKVIVGSAGLFEAAQVRFLVSPFAAPLWKLFEVALAYATGDYIVFWDDDNLSHPRRLNRQIIYAESLSEPKVVLFQSCIYLFYATKEIFIFEPNGDTRQRHLRTAACSALFPIDEAYALSEINHRNPGTRLIADIHARKARGEHSSVVIDEYKWFATGVLSDSVRGYDFHRDLVIGPAGRNYAQIVHWREEIETTLAGFPLEPGLWSICGGDGGSVAYHVEAGKIDV
jgi:hypothetical protein